MSVKIIPEVAIPINIQAELNAKLGNTANSLSVLTHKTDAITGTVKFLVEDTDTTMKYVYRSQIAGGVEPISRTITIPYTYSSAQIQTEIDNIGKYIPSGVTITLQFTNTSAKYFNGSTDNIVGDGTTATVTQAGHGFNTNDTVSLDTTELTTMIYKYFNGTTYTIVGNGTTATVTLNTHGFANGDKVWIKGTTNFNGVFTASSVATNTFVISSGYNGTETPANTATIETANFNGRYTVTKVDDNTYTFTHTANMTITPTTAAIARIPLIMTTGLTIQGFYGGGTLWIFGNTSETNAGVKHSNQQVILDGTSIINNYTLQIRSNQISINIYNIKFKFPAIDYAGIFAYQNNNTLIKCCYILGPNKTNTIYALFLIDTKMSAYLNYISNINYAFVLSYPNTNYTSGSYLFSYDNKEYHIPPNYGLTSRSSTIMKALSQPASTVSAETKEYGGQIFS